MPEIFGVWCEWDIGQEGQYFSSKEKAMDWLREDENLKEVMEGYEEYNSVEDLIAAGLVTITTAYLD